ncbi:MAG TPA: hypothetical protein VMZ69_05330, partial [Saprospiraceae bacterium]|nr:hypothetical protein [Saprospiraceae bacterium]
MQLFKIFLSVFLLSLCVHGTSLYGQVLISQSVGTPAATSMLEISSTSKGLLIPRMATTDRDVIGIPATSLLIFNTTTNAYNYWNGSAWIAIAAGNIKELSDADNDTKVEVERTPDIDKIHFEVGGIDVAFFNRNSLQLNDAGNSVFIGLFAGLNDDGTSNENTIIGSSSGLSISNGEHNVSLGANSSQFNSNGSDNTTLGHRSGNANTVSGNTFVGSASGESNSTGTGNAFFGKDAGKMSNTNNNTFIGFEAGKGNTIGTSNTFVGNGAGDVNSADNNTFIGKDAGGSNTFGL